MEPSDSEECNSNESGWTKYIGSLKDDGGYSDGGDDDNSNDDSTQAVPQDDDESDDSMASDASSGPSHHGFADFWQGNQNKYCINKKANKTQDKLIKEGKKVEKKGMLLIDRKGKSLVTKRSKSVR